MAIRKKSANAPAKAAGSVFRWAWGKLFRKSLMILLLILLGGLLFNLDRMGSTGVTLLKYKQFLPSFVVRFLPGGTAGEGKAVPEEVLRGEVIEVYDGDTITLLAQDKKYRVRFFGIDAPEAAQTYGTASRDALREKILGREVEVIVVSVDRYGRSVGKVMLGSRYINLEMVTEGNAWYYADYATGEYDLRNAEKEARSRKLGLWRGDSVPQEPWLYRKENRAR